jgi:hypothetical protein
MATVTGLGSRVRKLEGRILPATTVVEVWLVDGDIAKRCGTGETLAAAELAEWPTPTHVHRLVVKFV